MQTFAAGKCRYTDLTLEDIAPSWNKRLKQLSASRWSPKWLLWHSDIISLENCIVGEAFGQSPSYWDSCSECRAFSTRFPSYFGERAYKEMERDARRFAEHWNEKHAEIRRNQRGLAWFDAFVRFDDYIRTYR